MELPSFIPRVKGQAMTAAERQRLCRARGKGRHRGPALLAGRRGLAAPADVPPQPPPPPGISPAFEPSVSAMAA
jgi:hypothetical protein